jgi:hypothetical protein
MWRKAQGQVRDVAAFAAKQLAELEPAAYERPALQSSGLSLDQTVAWWNGPSSPKRIYRDLWNASLEHARKGLAPTDGELGKDGNPETEQAPEPRQRPVTVDVQPTEDVPVNGPQRPRTLGATARAESPALQGGEIASIRQDDDEVTQVALQLRDHQEAARRLGYAVDTVPQRVRSAEMIVGDEKRYRQWLVSIARGS